MDKFVSYLVRVGDALSQLLNVLVFLGQNSNESLSGRAYRMHRMSWPWNVAYTLINLIFIWQKDHCRLAYVLDRQRAARMLEHKHD